MSDTIFSIRGCSVSAALLDAWTGLLVADASPFFLTDALKSQLPAETAFLTRDESKEMRTDLSHLDTYQTYAVKSEGTWVVWLSSSEFDRLPVETRSAVLRAQWELKRGQVYDLNDVRALLQRGDATEYAMPCVAETAEGQKLVLDAALWRLLPVSVQRDWLRQYVLGEQVSYDSCEPNEVDWADVPSGQRTGIQALANRFRPRSGANCFATTLAATTADYATALSISDLWLHQAPFVRGLLARGFRPCSIPPEGLSHLRDAVLVWVNAAGLQQHACYVLGNGIALNKNSQAWYVPQQLVALSDLLTDWQDEPCELMVYQRSS